MSAITNIFGEDGFFWWIGVVEDRNDPLKVGRCRVRILGYHLDNKEVLPTSDLPWALPMQPITSAGISGKGSSPVGPLEGSWVIGFFADGKDKQQPMMMGTIGGLPDRSRACGAQEAAAQNNQTGVIKDSSGNVVKDSSGNPVTAATTTSSSTPANQEKNSNYDLIVAACKKRGLTDGKFLAAVIGNVEKECGGKTKSEDLSSYSNTSNERIRTVFGDRVAALSDAQISALKTNTAQFAETIYGAGTTTGRSLGNISAGDGYKYRGRGFIQITGKYNYAAASKEIYSDDRLVTNPDLANQPEVAAEIAGWFIKTNLSRATSNTGINYPGGTQNDSNVLVTSIVVGGDIRKKGNIGQEQLNKVAKFAADWVPGTPGGDRIAGTATPGVGTSTPGANTNQPDPNSTPATETLNDPKLGNPPPFADPNSAYPKCEYQDRPDTNKLATGDTSGTIIQVKSEQRITGIATANNGNWDEPDAAYCARYPYNHVVESESGHVIEMDDTPQRERLHLYHRTGTFVEMDQNGTFHQHVQGDAYGVYVRNNKVYIKGEYDVTVDGATRILSRDTLDMEVWGTTTINVKNNANINVAGNLKTRANNIYMEATGDLHLKAGGSMYAQAGSTMNIKSGGAMGLDGSTIDLNDGVAGSATATGLSALETASPINNPIPLMTRVGCDADAEFQGGNDGGEDPNKQQNDVASGKRNPADIEAGKATSAAGCKRSDTRPPAIVPPTPYKIGEFSGYREFPYTIQLSRSFKLGDLANVGSDSAAKNRDFWGNSNRTTHNGLTKSQIMDNLRGLTVNVLDPIKAKYPNMQMNSLLRFDVPSGGSAKSQHLIGQAVDLSFGNIQQHYDIALWIRDNVAYDQLLLEYYHGKGGFTSWIHVSFNPAGNRPVGSAFPKVATFMDHAVAVGLDGIKKTFLCDLSK
jgi:predicted chitinase